MLTEWFARLRFFFTGKRREDVDEELQFHLDRQVQENLAAGMPPHEARRQAVIAFGGRERAREQCREQLPSWTLELLLRDVRFALRGLWRNPGLTFVAAFTLALGIGASTAIFSAVNPILFQPLPYPHADRVMMIQEMRSSGSPRPVTFGTFHALSEADSRIRSYWR